MELQAISKQPATMLEEVRSGDTHFCLCCRGASELVHRFDAPPKGETHFGRPDQSSYRRELRRCVICGHFLAVSHVPLGELYTGQYVNATYGEDGIRAAYERIMTLDPSQSDNAGRVRRVLDLVEQHRPGFKSSDRTPSMLDVGSGLCVFPAAMKAAGWHCTALDPDERAVKHAREVAKVDAVCADFMTAPTFGQFDLITINKVLEHVTDPIAMLARCAEFMRDDSVIYIEVPDGEEAIKDGPDRQEFFIVHLHIFSMASLAMMIDRAGFRALRIERLREPSGKYTLWALLIRA